MIDDPYNFIELDEFTRRLMLAELDLDVAERGTPFLGKSLTAAGVADYPGLLRQAILEGTEVQLVEALNQHQRVTMDVSDAARKFGRTEFNRYYIRGICLRAADHKTTSVLVYRAHGSEVERPGSPSLIDTEQSAPRVLANMRATQGYDTDTGLGRVNSGLSVRCHCTPCVAA